MKKTGGDLTGQKRPQNHFSVGVRFGSHAYSVTARKDVTLTPRDVLNELEHFCARVRRDLAKATSVRPRRVKGASAR